LSRSNGPASVSRGIDFSAYYIAGKLVAERPVPSLYVLPLLPDGRLNLNTEVEKTSPWYAAAARYDVPYASPFIYPPLFAVLMKPLAHLSFWNAYLLWSVLTVLLAVAAVALSLQVADVAINGGLALMVGVGLFSYFPLWDNLFFGQAGGLILFLFAAGVLLLKKRETWGSTLCLALATWIKLTPALVVPVLVLHRRWKWLAVYAGWMVALLGFSVWQAGWFAHMQFVREALPSMSCGAPVVTNTTMVAWVQELFLGRVPGAKEAPAFMPAYACSISRVMALLVYCGILVRCFLRRKDGDVVRDVVVIALLSIAISPISWWHHYMLALLPFVYLWNTLGRRRMLAALAIVVGTNIVGLVALVVTNHAAQLALSAVVPGLVIAVAYGALAGGEADELAVPAGAGRPV
jgi:hypothetical protein